MGRVWSIKINHESGIKWTICVIWFASWLS